MSPQRRHTIGADPLDAVMPHAPAPEAESAPASAARAVTVGIAFLPELLERARNAVYWTPGLTLTELVNAGTGLVVDDLERSNGGRPFAPRRQRVRSVNGVAGSVLHGHQRQRR